MSKGWDRGIGAICRWFVGVRAGKFCRCSPCGDVDLLASRSGGIATCFCTMRSSGFRDRIRRPGAAGIGRIHRIMLLSAGLWITTAAGNTPPLDPPAGPPVFDPAREDWTSFSGGGSRASAALPEGRGSLGVPWVARPALRFPVPGGDLRDLKDPAVSPVVSLSPQDPVAGRWTGAPGAGATEGTTPGWALGPGSDPTGSRPLESWSWVPELREGLWAPLRLGGDGLRLGMASSPAQPAPGETQEALGRVPNDPDSFSGNLLILLGSLISLVVAASVISLIPRDPAPRS